MNGCMREGGHQVKSFVFVVALKKADLYMLFFSFVDFCLLFDFVILPAVHSLSLPLPSCLLSQNCVGRVHQANPMEERSMIKNWQ